MTGYCNDCGNTQCICAEVDADIKAGLVRRFTDTDALREYLLSDDEPNHHQTTPGRVTLMIRGHA